MVKDEIVNKNDEIEEVEKNENTVGNSEETKENPRETLPDGADENTSIHDMTETDKKTVSGKKKRRKNTNRTLLQRRISKYFPVFLLPTLIAFAIGFVYPFIKGVYLSFCQFTTTSDAEWIGIDNYIKVFQDAGFIHAFWYTAVFAIVSLILINVLAFTVAYALTQKIKGANLFRTVFFMPNLIGGIVLGYIWSMIFDGILSNYGTSIILDSNWGFWGLIILMCWQQIGYMMIIYIAGLQAVPGDLLEAAKIDGAGHWKSLWRVTIPNVMPSITICMFLTLTNSFKLFDQNLALTGGAPYTFEKAADGSLSIVKTTEMLALNIYNTFYGQSATARGTAQAKAVIFFLLVAVISVAQLRATRRKEVQQ